MYQGDALSILKSFPSDSVDCIVTSPPYWALRAYQTEPQIWDGNPRCRHEWVAEIAAPEGYSGQSRKRWQHGQSRQTATGTWTTSLTHGTFCQFCGAWRGELGLEPNFDLYLKHLCDIFDEAKRVLKRTGTCWVNLGDCYAGSGGPGGDYGRMYRGESKAGMKDLRGANPNKKVLTVPDKSLVLVPFRFALAMVDRGWRLRNTVVWHKPNCMPQSVTDRFTVDFDYIFFFVKSQRYYFNQQFEPAVGDHASGNGFQRASQIARGGRGNSKPWYPKARRNRRCVWKVPTRALGGSHFAVYPEALVETPIRAGSPPGGVVLDPFLGAGTTAVVAKKLRRKYIGIELNPEYVALAEQRIGRRRAPSRVV